MYIIRCENGGQPWWLNPFEGGDPGRTCVESSAKRYTTRECAQRALNKTVKNFPERKLEGRLEIIEAK